jgi:hypothetical protein
MAIETQIQFTIKTDNPFQVKAKLEHLKVLAKLDNEALQKIVELSKSNQAIAQLKNNFSMIQSFLG